MQQESEAPDLPEKLQEFGLPVFKCVPAHFDDKSGQFRSGTYRLLFVGVGKPVKYPVANEAQSEEAACNPCESVPFWRYCAYAAPAE